jgi:ribonuclease HII
MGIVPATCLAIYRALEKISPGPQHLLVDYLRLADIDLPQTPLVKGDARSLSIASASILAKTTRDAILVEMDSVYSGYSLSRNKGYGTAAHRQAIERLGPCEIHRRSFAPISDYYSLFPPDGRELSSD